MTAAVGELVERFDSHRDAYRSGHYWMPSAISGDGDATTSRFGKKITTAGAT